MSVAFEGAFIIYESELFSAFLAFSGFPCLITNWEQVQSKLSIPLIPISTHDRAMFLVIHVHRRRGYSQSDHDSRNPGVLRVLRFATRGFL